ncbi:MAG TPA: Na+/H+ antiporter subunit D [Phycisphaeraceae bacterium]|nr:Na+/H+ antiporter subunit D [Phycisphaeraceae bacterium]
MNPNLIILFIVIPMATGIITLALRGHLLLQRLIGVSALTINLALALITLIYSYSTDTILVTQMGDWPAPFGISIVVDSLSGLVLVAGAIVSLACYLHAFGTIDRDIEEGFFHPLWHLIMFGIQLSFITGDLFNLFVSFEIMLMASYALLTLGTTRKQITQSYKYVMLNLLASGVFVLGAGLIYSMTGTLNYADLARFVEEHRASGTPLPAAFNAVAVLLLMVFGCKAAIFPLWFWLPDTYYTCPTSIAAFFSGMLTKVGVYALARLYPMIFATPFVRHDGVTQQLLLIAAAFTMFLGVLGAVSMHNIRRILAIHVISQVGYMIFGIALLTQDGIRGCMIYMVQHMVVKSSLFLCSGVVEKYRGTDDLNKLGGLAKQAPWLATLFFIAAMSLVGLPPLSGFFGKYVVIKEGFLTGYWWLSMFGLLTGLLTLLSMLKIFGYAFWSPKPEAAPASIRDKGVKNNPSIAFAYIGIVILVTSALFIGFGAQFVNGPAGRAGDIATNPHRYIAAVLGEETWQRIEHPDNVEVASIEEVKH